MMLMRESSFMITIMNDGDSDDSNDYLLLVGNESEANSFL